MQKSLILPLVCLASTSWGVSPEPTRAEELPRHVRQDPRVRDLLAASIDVVIQCKRVGGKFRVTEVTFANRESAARAAA